MDICSIPIAEGYVCSDMSSMAITVPWSVFTDNESVDNKPLPHVSRYTQPFQPTSAFLPCACSYDIVALPTFPDFHMDLLGNLSHLNCPGQRYLAVVHNPRLLIGRDGAEMYYYHVLTVFLSLCASLRKCQSV
jgi:hypothetical protein